MLEVFWYRKMVINIDKVEQALHSLVTHDLENRVFCSGGKLKKENVLLPLLSVPGAEDIGIPITPKDVKILKSCSTQVSSFSSSTSKKDQRGAKYWKIDISANYRRDAALSNFFLSAATPLVLRGLNDLKFDIEDTQAIDIQPRSILIFDSGSHYDECQDDDTEPGVFATMHLQIPVKRGFSGGNFSIVHGNQSKVFDFSSASSEDYYYVLFNADCYHSMQPVTGGSKVVLVSSLAWKHCPSVFKVLHTSDDKYLGNICKELEKALTNWRLPANHIPRKLAIPLEHQYSVAKLSFARLKGSDRLVTSLLRSIEFIDLHLAIVCQSTENDSDRKTTKNYRKRIKTDSQIPLEDVITLNGEAMTEYWVSSVTDAPFPFVNLKIETHEIVRLGGNPKPMNDKSNKFFNAGPLRQKCFYNSMLVIWPSSRTLNFACRYGFVGSLDILERLYKKQMDGNEKQEDGLPSLLEEVVAFCCSDPSYILNLPSKVGEVICRLLRLSIDLSSIEQGLAILRLVAQDFPDKSKWNTKTFEGIPAKEVANTIAQFVHLAGWDACAELIRQLVTFERLASQTEPLIRLVTSLIDRGLVEAGREVAHLICSFIFTRLDASNVDSKTSEAIGEMMFRLRDFDDSFASEQSKLYVEWLEKITSQLLCEIVIYLRRCLAPLIMRNHNVKAMYIDVCFVLARRRFEGEDLKPVTNKPLLADVLQCFIWPYDVRLVQTFIHQIIQPTIGNNQALEDLVTSWFVWKLCLPSIYGKLILTALVETRLKELSCLSEPVFSWSMPDAVVPNEPELESFLQSSNEFIVLPHIFQDMKEAISWASNIFGPSFECLPSLDSSFFRTNRYSAVPKFKKVPGGFACEVTKNRRLHEHYLGKYSLRMREKECLVTRHCTRLRDIKEKTLKNLDLDLTLKNNFC